VFVSASFLISAVKVFLHSYPRALLSLRTRTSCLLGLRLRWLCDLGWEIFSSCFICALRRVATISSLPWLRPRPALRW